MLHLAPDLVDMSVATRNVPEQLADEPLRPIRRQRRLRMAVERLRAGRPHRRPHDGHRRTGRGAVRRRGRRILRRTRRDRRVRTARESGMTHRRRANRHRPPARRGSPNWVRSAGSTGRTGEWGNARLALTDDDRAGRELVVAWMRDLGLSVADRRDRQRVRHPPGNRPAGRTGDDRLAHRHRSHRRSLRRQPGRARRVGGGGDAGAARHRHRATVRRGVLHRRGGSPIPARHAGQPRVRRRDAARGGARRHGGRRRRTTRRRTRTHRLRRPLPCPTAVPPHRFFELHIEQGPILEAEGVDIGVVEGVQGISWTEIHPPRSVGPRRHDADAAPPRSRARRRPDRRFRPRVDRRDRGRAGRHRGADRGANPTW